MAAGSPNWWCPPSAFAKAASSYQPPGSDKPTRVAAAANAQSTQTNVTTAAPSCRNATDSNYSVPGRCPAPNDVAVAQCKRGVVRRSINRGIEVDRGCVATKTPRRWGNQPPTRLAKAVRKTHSASQADAPRKHVDGSGTTDVTPLFSSWCDAIRAISNPSAAGRNLIRRRQGERPRIERGIKPHAAGVARWGKINRNAKRETNRNDLASFLFVARVALSRQRLSAYSIAAASRAAASRTSTRSCNCSVVQPRAA